MCYTLGFFLQPSSGQILSIRHIFYRRRKCWQIQDFYALKLPSSKDDERNVRYKHIHSIRTTFFTIYKKVSNLNPSLHCTYSNNILNLCYFIRLILTKGISSCITIYIDFSRMTQNVSYFKFKNVYIAFIT